MEKAEEIRKKEQFSMQMNGFSRDPLTKHVGKSSHGENRNEEEEIELSLGLSLNGKFGVDPKRAAQQSLVRSSSIADFMLFGDDGKTNTRVMPGVSYAPPLMRTCSLPAEWEEWRKRKEMQSLRRKEVKRKRMERKSIVRVVREKVVDVEEEEENDSVSNADEKDLVTINVISENENDYCNNGFPYSYGSQGCGSSHGSLGSQGSGSSGISDFEPIQGMNKNTEEKRQSLPEQKEEKRVAGAAEKEAKEAKERFKTAMLDMPCVSTRGEGPNGKKIDGFLYKFQKGEEVRIVCVCHGSFLTPAEFVKHGGGGDVTHPLRHIVINPSPIL